MRNFFSVCLFQSDYVDKVGIGMTLIITIIYLPSLMMMRCTTLPQIAACLPHALAHYPTYRRRRRHHITLTPPCRHRTLRQHTNSEPTESLKIRGISSLAVGIICPTPWELGLTDLTKSRGGGEMPVLPFGSDGPVAMNLPMCRTTLF